ncbi:MAG: hypothetical protein GWN21_04765 [Gammaproteobacteria bacterium]|nr:hypothetical protein [Gammaproteobacteria bacterium]NIR23032.1 hypothetical protein [Gammaproteobacteria bacterium]NIS04305.1 hypothetical protein [Gammaproteobacteria bacterium]NIV46488.1 hypothetical protein [Gammaproteobacteria bacterium]NIW01521.1 hypothetical protein [Gammaproteobacteria bacterium]
MSIARLFASFALLPLLAAVLTGCADLEKKDQTKKLDQSVRSYIRAIRWGDLGAAASYIRPREGEVDPPDLSKLQGLRVTRYDYAVDSKYEGDPEALMTVRFDYYFEDTLSVKKVYQQAVWWWDPEVENWFMDGALPEFER